MPELPEVETIARGLEKELSGAVIASVEELRAGMVEGDRERFFATLPGARLRAVTRRGKLLLMPLEREGASGGETLVFHLRMSGALLIQPAQTPPGPHTRMVFRLMDGRQLFFEDTRTFGISRLLNEAEKNQWPFWKNLGPEPLGISGEAFARLFAGARRAIKAMLLDQAVIAGIGNIYADETLFRAGIHPQAPGGALSARRLELLREKLEEVLQEAISQCGSSIRDYRDANGHAGAFQNSFRVYGRAGRPCARCGAPLRSLRVAGRATVFCPNCQKA